MNASIVNIRSNLADTLNRVAYAGERVVLERRGKPVAALVSIKDLESLERLENEADLHAVRKARKERGKPVSLAKVKMSTLLSTFEASEIIGCHPIHVNWLIRHKKLSAKKEVKLNRHGRPCGYTYQVAKKEAERVRDSLRPGGWPRGKPRKSM
jgi:prevent-host-death family protein